MLALLRSTCATCTTAAVLATAISATGSGGAGLPPAAASLFDQLSSVSFLNSGVTAASDSFFFEDIDAIGDGQKLIYLEADNVSCVHCVWSDGGKYYVPHPYLFKANPSDVLAQAQDNAAVFEELSSLDWTEPPILDKGEHSPSEDACKAKCASMPSCNVVLYLNGTTRHGECWLSGRLRENPRADFCGAKPGQSCASFKKQGTKPTPAPSPAPRPPPAPTHPPGIYRGSTPASGMRSAVPLGGIGAGSFELRGDGSLHEFIIHNAGPGGAAKIQTYPDAFFAMAVDGESRVLRTHPPAGMKGVERMRYSGTHPISRLQVLDDVGGVEATLYGFSAFKVADMPASGRPAAAFSLAVTNGGNTARNVSFMLQLPLQTEEDQARPGTPLPGVTPEAASPADCLAACAKTGQCLSWTWTSATSTCVLQSDAPLNRWEKGVTSGIAGSWSPTEKEQCLHLNRPGTGPMHGDASLCASASLPHAWGWAAESEAHQAFARLGGQQTVASAAAVNMSLQEPYGAVSVSTMVPANANVTLTISFGWNFPYRDMYNYGVETAAFVPFGNQYASYYANSVESAWGALAPGGPREAALAEVVADASVVSHALSGSLPQWLTDLLANSLSHTRDSMWWQQCPHCHNSSDPRVEPSTFGIWRQYEAYDCPDLGALRLA